MENEAPVTMIRERDREERQRNRLIGYLRIVFVILLSVIVALGIVSESTETTSGVQLSNYWWLLAGGTAIFFRRHRSRHSDEPKEPARSPRSCSARSPD